MEGYKKNTDLNPHILVQKGDDVVINIVKTHDGIACFNYVYGYGKKICIEFHRDAKVADIAKYVSACLDKTIEYTLTTNMGTISEKMKHCEIFDWLTSTIEYMNAIQFARYP